MTMIVPVSLRVRGEFICDMCEAFGASGLGLGELHAKARRVVRSLEKDLKSSEKVVKKKKKKRHTRALVVVRFSLGYHPPAAVKGVKK